MRAMRSGPEDAVKSEDHTDTVPFQVAVRQRDSQSALIVLSGELDLASAPKLRDCLAELAGVGIRNIETDLTNLTFLDSTGISLLVTEFKRTSSLGGSFTVTNVPAQAMKVLEITGLVELLAVRPLEESGA